MRKSARILGQGYGLTAQEMNFVLREEGFLDGEPGSYAVTEKGARFAHEQDHSRGTGGYGQYNKAWTTRTWADEIADEMDITEERKSAIRQAISVAKQRIGESTDEGVVVKPDILDSEHADTADGNDDALAAAVGFLLVTVSAYGIYKVAPYIKQLWNNKAVSGLKNVRDRVLAKQETEEGTETESRRRMEDQLRARGTAIIRVGRRIPSYLTCGNLVCS
jgi:hypothetical protein